MGQQAEEEVDESLFPSSEDLKEANDIWAGGVEENDKAKPVGSFQATINEATLERSGSGDRLQIHYEVEIFQPGPHKDLTLHKYDGLGSKQQASISQNQLRRLGVDTKKVGLKQLPAVLLELKGKKVVINCRQKGEYHNIFFTKLIGPGLAGARPAATAKAGVPAGAAGKKKF